eukprot:scaffold37699_cov176-Amphora_coffeaeformis.AAC.2
MKRDVGGSMDSGFVIDWTCAGRVVVVCVGESMAYLGDLYDHTLTPGIHLTMTKDWAEERMLASLQQREEKGTLRRLPAQDQASPARSSSSSSTATIDFSSNDYLGLAQSPAQAKRVEELFAAEQQQQHQLLGATGSRLLSGDSPVFHQLETYLAHLHEKPAALLCNSGYDANLSLVSSLPCDIILYDEYAHNSLHMAMRLWQTRDEIRRTAIAFQHNSTRDLQEKLQQLQQQQYTSTPTVVVIVESVYSMDGDCAPLAEILDQAASYGARVVVDEAHGLGASGPTGLLSALGLHQHPALLSAVYTFGKGAGCHGAVITGSRTLQDYLTNFGYPFIYSTAMSLHSLCTIRASYETMTSARGDALRAHLGRLIEMFQTEMTQQIISHHAQQWNTNNDVSLIPSTTAIQALVVPGNQRCSAFCQTLWRRSQHRIRLFPIKSPTVPAGRERVRIVLHAHNTVEQVREFIQLVQVCLQEHPEEQTARSKL